MSRQTARVASEDLDILEAFLASERVSDDAMDISTLDGFLAGLAVGPEMIMPSEWLPLVWGPDEPVYEGPDEAQHILHVIMARYNEILTALRANPERYGPLFYEDTDGALLAGPWAEGFVAAIRLRPEAWGPIFEDEESAVLVMPIVLTGRSDRLAEEIEIADAEKDRFLQEAAGVIPTCVVAIDEFWRARRLDGPLLSRRSPKVGRNAPCPCGSGQKYKRCCGASA